MIQSDPPMQSRVREMFGRAAFVTDLGIELTAMSEGQCETQLQIQPRHLQQTQAVHAGVISTIADHTAGGAASTHLKDGEFVLTIEFKINFLRAAQGEQLKCRSKALKAGRTLVCAESEVFAVHQGKETLVSKALVTLAVLKQRE